MPRYKQQEKDLVRASFAQLDGVDSRLFDEPTRSAIELAQQTLEQIDDSINSDMPRYFLMFGDANDL